ncbi:hypothetical protein PX343_07180 [Citrobacter koseri]|uniref:hypothetical protein n=1 Tax=Citrobacter koseri TaxID=545 RepID=UPI0023AAEE63|nr:hypothetical protein [Citrobacter koseri]WEE18685.1 hypothetical protein PX343_07180 [Citrobacter koseri]
MKLIITPQRANKEVKYSVSGDALTVMLDGESDTFDFSEMPDGHTTEFCSVLEPCPVLMAVKKDGELSVTVTGFYGKDASALEKTERVEVY